MGPAVARYNPEGKNLHSTKIVKPGENYPHCPLCDLRGADLTMANLRKANLSEADLNDADFAVAYLAGVIGADFSGATDVFIPLWDHKD